MSGPVASLLAACVWALLIWVVSAAAFLAVRPLFSAWHDQGYGLAKVLGPWTVGALAWVVGGLGGTPWPAATTWTAILTLLIAAAIVVRQRLAPLPPLRVLARIELAWLACFFLFAAIRACNPSIVGGERPADHALLAALLRQPALPPVDPWFAGESVNYHYGGYALWTPVAHLSGASISIVYNLILATLPAQALVAAWSVGRRLSPAFAWIGALALVAAAPLGTLAAAASPWQGSTLRSTQMIPYTVNEFPFFSFVRGELHPHLLALPLLIGLAAMLVRLNELANTTDAARSRNRVATVVAFMVAAGLAGSMVMTSTWDVVPAAIAAVWALILVTRMSSAWRAVAAVLAMAVFAAFLLPLFAHFRPPRVPVGFEWHGTALRAFAVVLGIWLAPLLLLLLHRGQPRGLVLALVVIGAAAAFAPGWAARVAIIAVAAGSWSAREAIGRPASALVMSALLLIFLAESLWIDDIYGWDYRRLNVVFKWHLHAIVLLVCAWPAIVSSLSTGAGRLPWIGRRLALIGIAGACIIYPVAVIGSAPANREALVTLDGLAGMTTHHPGDAEAVRYLRTHADALDVVLEAAGDAYTYASRISSMTGQPTLLGWRLHERLWRRGGEWETRLSDRAGLIDTLYDGPIDTLAAALHAARVRYIVVGPVERRRYPALTPERFVGVANVVVDGAGTTLLRVD